jgi:hypothetical protein
MKIPPSLVAVAKRLGPLRERVVFVGGMIRGLLVTDPAAGPPRPTDDVDLIVDVPSRQAYYELGEQLRELGFQEDVEEGAPICRWVVDGVRADVMPIDPGILGFSNVWYAGASDHARITKTPDGEFRHLDGPHFCATKLEAFASRAEGNLYHHDLEDFIALVDERESLVDEIDTAPKDLRDFLAETVAGLLASQPFLEALPGHLQGDEASQRRLPLLLSRLHRIADLRIPTAKPAPLPSVFPPPPSASVPPRATHRSSIATGSPKLWPTVAPGPVPLRSSNLHSVEYDPTTRSLTIQFHSGGIYRYAEVPSGVYEGLLRAYSAGRYFHQWIRNRYRSQRLRG